MVDWLTESRVDQPLPWAKKERRFYWHLYVLGLLYRVTLRTEPSDRDVRNRSAASRNVDLGTRYVTVCVVSLVAGRSGEKRYTMRRMERGFWGGGVGKQWTEKESFQQYFYSRYKILHTCHTYCCYAYHLYVSPKTYKWFGTFIIKDGRYTFTFFSFKLNTTYKVCNIAFFNIVQSNRRPNIVYVAPPPPPPEYLTLCTVWNLS
jgi:hypothetical protein